MPDIFNNPVMSQPADDYSSEADMPLMNSFVNVIPLQPCSDMPVPFSPEEFWNIEQEICRHALQAADGIMLEKLTKLHGDKAFVKECVEKAGEKILT